MDLEKAKALVRPQGIHQGLMKMDEESCNSCGLCVQNCPFGCWEMEKGEAPTMKEEHKCISCSNCMVCCPKDSISLAEPYYVSEGPWATEPHRLPLKLPLEPKDADGQPDEWNAIERAVFERRSVRNFKQKAVPDHLIRRVLEAGRFAPSGGNCQPWRFIVITDRDLIQKMDEATWAMASGLHSMYNDDDQIEVVGQMAESTPGGFDPRAIQGGMGAITDKSMAASLGAPCVILLAADRRAIGGAELAMGIAGQNMNLVANSLGIKACWVGFLTMAVGAVADKIDLGPNWSVVSTLVMGWPRFKQEGVVAREYRPVTWLREGAEESEIEE